LNNKLKEDANQSSENKPTLDDLLEKITPENQHNEIDFGQPLGKELI